MGSVCSYRHNAALFITHLELVLQQVLLVGELAIEAEEAGFVSRHFLCLMVNTGLFRASHTSRQRQGSTSEVAGRVQGRRMTYADVHLVLLVGVHDGGRLLGMQRALEEGVAGGRETAERVVVFILCPSVSLGHRVQDVSLWPGTRQGSG
jgi:hypothetical protein